MRGKLKLRNKGWNLNSEAAERKAKLQLELEDCRVFLSMLKGKI